MTAQASSSAPEPSRELQDLPPSAKLVAKALEYEGELTQAEIVEWTLLAPRTVRYAVSELEEAGVIASRISFVDARQRIYSLETQEKQ